MNINVTWISEILFVSILIVGSLSYYLGKRKTNTPKVAALIGSLLCFVPPMNLIYLIILVFKDDLAGEAPDNMVN